MSQSLALSSTFKNFCTFEEHGYGICKYMQSINIATCIVSLHQKDRWECDHSNLWIFIIVVHIFFFIIRGKAICTSLIAQCVRLAQCIWLAVCSWVIRLFLLEVIFFKYLFIPQQLRKEALHRSLNFLLSLSLSLVCMCNSYFFLMHVSTSFSLRSSSYLIPNFIYFWRKVLSLENLSLLTFGYHFCWNRLVLYLC